MSQKPRVFLALPRYSEFVVADALEAALVKANPSLQVTVETAPVSPPRIQQHYASRQTSLMCYTHNLLWTSCLKGPFDYFVVQHSDVVPLEMGWLAVAVEECRAGNFDVIHAPQALKETRGVTSTMGAYSDDIWQLARRLTVSELQCLPQRFGIEDVRELDEDWGDAQHMLPNTGLMVVKLGPWAKRFPGFTVSDRIVWVYPSTGDVIRADQVTDEWPQRDCIPVAQVVADDAMFGHWCHANGLKVGGTRAVPCNHVGMAQYPNYREWGESDVDEAYFAARKPV